MDRQSPVGPQEGPQCISLTDILMCMYVCVCAVCFCVFACVTNSLCDTIHAFVRNMLLLLLFYF